MTLEDMGERIVNAFYDALFDALQEYIFPNLDKIPVPPLYKMFITQRNAYNFITIAKQATKSLPPEMKRNIAVRVKRAIEKSDEEYVRAVFTKTVDESAGLFMEALGEIKWNGI